MSQQQKQKQDKNKQTKPNQNKNKAKQNRTEQNKTKQNKTKKNIYIYIYRFDEPHDAFEVHFPIFFKEDKTCFG